MSAESQHKEGQEPQKSEGNFAKLGRAAVLAGAVAAGAVVGNNGEDWVEKGKDMVETKQAQMADATLRERAFNIQADREGFVNELREVLGRDPSDVEIKHSYALSSSGQGEALRAMVSSMKKGEMSEEQIQELAGSMSGVVSENIEAWPKLTADGAHRPFDRLTGQFRPNWGKHIADTGIRWEGEPPY